MKLWLNVAQGAEYAGVCRDLINDACDARKMHIRVGGRRAIRLKPEWIDAWLERQRRSKARFGCWITTVRLN